MKSYPGVVVGDTIEVRFAYSGRISAVAKRVGDSVKAKDLLASLDKRIIQTELDKELADYERIRAEFEIFVSKQGQPQTDIAKYEKIQIQSQLTVSVKSVELVKYRLDQADLYSPIAGTVISDGGNRPGLFATPASNAFQILDQASLRFRIEIAPDDLPVFVPAPSVVVTVGDKDYPGTCRQPLFIGKQFTVDVTIADTTSLFVGLPGNCRFSA